MTIYNHHFVPRHAGGNDDPSNLVRVTLPEHTAFHYERWVLTGDEFDRIAWRCLGGQITMSEAQREAQREGLRRGPFISGANHAKNKTGVCGRSKEQMSIDGRKGGRVAGAKNRDKKIGLFGRSKEQITIDARKAGKASTGGMSNKLNKTGICTVRTRPHCGKTGAGPMLRWHFDNCKKRG